MALVRTTQLSIPTEQLPHRAGIQPLPTVTVITQNETIQPEVITQIAQPQPIVHPTTEAEATAEAEVRVEAMAAAEAEAMAVAVVAVADKISFFPHSRFEIAERFIY